MRRQRHQPPPLRCLWKPSVVVAADGTVVKTEDPDIPTGSRIRRRSSTAANHSSSGIPQRPDSKLERTTTAIQLLSYDDIYNYYCLSPALHEMKNTDSGAKKAKLQYDARPRASLFRYISNALLVVQEFILVCYFLAWYRIIITPSIITTNNNDTTPSIHAQLQQTRQYYLDVSMICMYIALLFAVFLNARAAAIMEKLTGTTTLQGERPTYSYKVLYRLIDATILAGMVRYIAVLLRNLTVSYSTDTVERLAVLAMIVHVLCCDYTYANGYDINLRRKLYRLQQQQRISNSNTFHPPNDDDDSHLHHTNTLFHTTGNVTSTFMGGTISLNAAFFATIVLVSRFDTISTTSTTSSSSTTTTTNTTFMFISLAVIIFAFYPVTRHTISLVYPSHKSGTTTFVD
jgi:Phosphatidylinositol N-acetylglucosaminyltransferase